MKRGMLFVKCQIIGENSFSLIEKLHKIKIYTYDVAFFEQKIFLSIDFADYKKLFAISRNMCYNIRILKYYGKVSLLKKAVSKLGLVICFSIFFLLSNLFDGYVSKISYEGDGEYFSPQISAFLLSEGVKEKSLLQADLKVLENKLLQSIDGVAYVSLKKSGRVLTVEAYRAEENVQSIDLKKAKISSSVNGTVTAINVLSGTACIGVGDKVKVGDVLIDGYFLKGEEKLSTYALGEVEIEVEYVFTYQSFTKGERYSNRACVLARESLGEQNVVRQEVKEDIIDGKTIYVVTLYYLVTVS